MKVLTVIFSSVLLISACTHKVNNREGELTATDNKNNLKIVITKIDHGEGTILHSDIYRNDKLIDSSDWELPGDVIKMQVGDVDDNGIDELFVIPVKTTRYDSVKRPRPFFFKLQKGHIVPLWLGSRLHLPMVDARLAETPNGIRLRSIVKDSNDVHQVVDYKWKGFGLSFDRYILENATSTEARKTFNKEDL